MQQAKPSPSLRGVDDRVDEAAILEPYTYINSLPGKGVRGQLIDAFNEWLCVAAEPRETVKRIVGMLHNASLLIDDIEDNSKLRRGSPVAHAIYGVAATINSANLVYFQALQACLDLNEPAAMAVFSEELVELHRGQGKDIYWRDHGLCPSESEYKDMVGDKTGGLFRLAVRLMQIFSTDKTDYRAILADLGLYFQVLDDYVNLKSAKYQKNKSYCEDLTEGKFSFPIIHSIHALPNDTRLLHILRQRTEDVTLKRHAVQLMEETGSFAYTRAVIGDLRRSLDDHIELLGGNERLTRILDELDKQLEAAEPKDTDLWGP